MGVLVNSSLITSFLAGVAALFAPCCITVLLPAYLGSVFSQRRKVLLMTFVFGLGIALVFLPIGLGIGGLGALFTRLHDWIFIAGALFLLLLGASLLFGFHPKFPFNVSPGLAKPGIGAVLLLGVFSGLATTCCAPVMAGVVALSILPGSVFWGGMYAFGYVLGMVVPLVAIALFLDRVNFTDRFLLFRKSVRILGREVALSSLAAGVLFLGMGALILFLSLTGRLQAESGFQVAVNLLITRYVESARTIAERVPVFVIPLLFAVILAAIAIVAVRRRAGRSRSG